MAETISEATARSEQLIERLLLLAKSERSAIDPQPVDLDSVVREVASDLTLEARERRVRFSLTLDHFVVHGDEVLLNSLVRNLLENAIRHNVSGGRVDVATSEHDGMVNLVVASDGPRIPGAELGQLFEPFQRLDRNANETHGAGLGLAIVKAVVDAHKGTLDAKPCPDGGLSVQVTFRTGMVAAR